MDRAIEQLDKGALTMTMNWKRLFSLMAVGCVAALLVQATASAIVIAQYDLNATDDDLTVDNPDPNLASATDFTAGAFQISGQDAADVSFINNRNGYGPNITAGTGNPTNYTDAVAAGYVYTFTLTADTGYQINLDGFDIDPDINSGGLNRYSVDVNADGNGFETAFLDVVLNGTADSLAMSASLLDPADYQGLQSLTVRIVHYRNSGAVSGTRSAFQDVKVNGSVIPEPASLALLGLGGLCLLTGRRR